MARTVRTLGALAAMAGVALLLRPRRRREDLAGKVALVTGGSRGFGLLLARRLGERGMRVVLCARDQGELERARASLAGAGIEVLALPCDVSDADQVQRTVVEATSRLGAIDLLVNDAGIIQVGPSEAMSLDDYRAAMATMFWGSVHATTAVLPQMRARRSGIIVDVTSIGAALGVPHLAPYSAAKFAHRGFSEAMGAELRKDGIHVVTVLPGLMRTGSVGHALVKGSRSAEASLFAVAGSAPLVTRSAERNAERVLRAIDRRERFVALGVQAKAARILHALLPGTTIALLGMLNALLPSARGADPGDPAVPGEPWRRGLARSVLTALGDRAARRLNEERAR